MDNAEVIVGVDGSPQADAAVRWAAARARHTGARLRLLHAYSVPVPAPAMSLAAAGPYAADRVEYAAEAGEAVLAAAAELARGHADGVEVSTELRVGGAAQALIDASEQAGLVVVGSRGLGGFTGLLLGSVGVQVSAHARCPTVVVHGDAPATGPVVVGVDGSDLSRAAVAFAFAEADRLGTGVIAVHAWGLPMPTGAGDGLAVVLAGEDEQAKFARAAGRVLADALTDVRQRYPDVTVDERLVQAGSAGALLEAAADATMIVVGSRGHGGFKGLLLGSTSQTVLQHAGCPVAVVRTEPAD